MTYVGEHCWPDTAVNSCCAETHVKLLLVIVSVASKCSDLIRCLCVSRDRKPLDMDEQEREVLDWEMELAKQNIPYIDMDDANLVFS